MTYEDFKQFRHEAVHQLVELNDQCEKEFRLEEWSHYSYNLEIATLTFSRDGIPRVIAGIQLVGTTSPDQSTWTWGWADDDAPQKCLEAMDKVRAYGEREGIPQLTQARLSADEHLGWEMTAIAARLLDGKGAFRCPRPGGGALYFVYRDIGYAPDKAAATIQCQQHGRGFPAYVCEHLAADPAQRWFSDEASQANRWPDAWCATCDAIFLEEGEWNERTGTRLHIRTVCHRCYEGMRSQASAE